jgi:hypothetical protein
MVMTKYSAEQVRKQKYGLPPEEYNHMLAQQQNACAICRQETKLVVDHCHNSGKVRGLLCASCNAGLGAFDDDPVNLALAIAYLATHKPIAGRGSQPDGRSTAINHAPRIKLTARQAYKIFHDPRNSYADIALDYNVTPGTVAGIKKRTRWKAIDMDGPIPEVQLYLI